MITLQNKKIIRKMLKDLMMNNIYKISNVSGSSIFDIFLMSLWMNDEISYRAYRKYNRLFDKHRSDYRGIISFKG